MSLQVAAGLPVGITSDVIIGSGPPPGFGGGVSLVLLDGQGINAAGDIVFRARLQGAGISGDNDDSLWVHQDALGPVMMARAGNPAVGYDFFTTYESFAHASIDDSGQVLYTAFIDGPGIEQPDNLAYWAGTPTQLNRILTSSDIIAGTVPPTPYGGLSSSLIHGAAGHVGILHLYRTGDEADPFADGLIIGPADDLSLYIADNGQGSANDLQFRFLHDPRINRNGHVAFHSGIPGGVLGIYASVTGVPAEVVRFSQQAPGLAEGITFEGLALSQLRHDGSVGFMARLEGPGIHANNDFSYWVAPPGGEAELLVREWDFLPSHDGSTRLRTLETVTFNNNGNVAFTGNLNVTDSRANAGLWFGTPGQYELVLQEGHTEPAIPGMDIDSFFLPQLNNRDLLVFVARLREIGFPNPSELALWAYRDGVAAPVVLPGDMVDIAGPGMPTDLREVESLSVGGGPALEDGRNHTLNDNDQVAVILEFTDGSTALMRYDLTGFFAPGDPGDLTGDGFVGVEDLDILLANWGRTTYAGSWRDGDADGDGVVGQGDLDVVIANWSAGTPPGGVVPEPTGVATLLAMIGLAARRRRA